MVALGYRKIPQTGSVYRFEPDGSRDESVTSQWTGKAPTIVFRAPHRGRHRGKLPHRLAKAWWGDRLQNHIIVEL